ncbi:hypothetical protein G6F57_020470 [Rhizopus arrhizus]|nr:hypothetical protein G6F57_020470 [Rhizopus arrhizus]
MASRQLFVAGFNQRFNLLLQRRGIAGGGGGLFGEEASQAGIGAFGDGGGPGDPGLDIAGPIVDQAFLDLLGAVDLVEGRLHFLRRTGVLQGQAGHGQAGLERLQQRLQALFGGHGQRATVVQHGIEVGAADFLAHRALRRLLKHLVGIDPPAPGSRTS